MRIQARIALVMLLLAACRGSGVHQAETIPGAFPGTLLRIQPAGPCAADGCPFEYRVRITNPTDRDASVQECIMPTAGIRIPVMGIAGLGVSPHSTVTELARFLLPVSKHTVTTWPGRSLSCVGLDWHGDPPV